MLTPLIESLANIENFNDKFDMIDSPLKVKSPDQKIFLDSFVPRCKTCSHPLEVNTPTTTVL